MAKSGVPGAGKRAKDWLYWGMALEQPAMGSVAVLDFGHDRYHVGFVTGTYKGMLVLIGGNQANSVCKLAFPKEYVVACRYPTKPDSLTAADYVPTFYLPTEIPEGVTDTNKVALPPVTTRTEYPHADHVYRSEDRTTTLTIMRCGPLCVHFRIYITGTCARTISGTAYDVYPDGVEIDQESGIAYPCIAYHYWGDEKATTGLYIRLSIAGPPRAIVTEWWNDSRCELKELRLR